MAPTTLTERVRTVERRTDRLEEVLAAFMERTEGYMERIDAVIERMDQHAALDRTEAEERWAESDARVERLREEAARRSAEWDARWERSREEAARRSAESDARWERLERRAARERAQMNETWGNLANKMGTVVEDIVAPSIRRLAPEIFDCGAETAFYTRASRTRGGDPSRTREFDALYVGERAVLLNETKSTVRSEDARAFAEFVRAGEFARYFPEHAELPIVPAFSSLSLPEDMVTYLTRQGIYAIAMGDEAMQVLNRDEVRRRRARA